MARTPTTVETLICEVIAEMTEAQSEAVTTFDGVSFRGISSSSAETAKTVVNNIVFVPGKNLINSISLIKHIGGDLFDVRYAAAARPGITGYLLDAVQIVIVIMYALILANSMLDA